VRLQSATASSTGQDGSDTDGDVLVLDAPLRFVVPLAGPFGALLLLAMAWLSLP
jgi:hypothetical protein